MGSTAKQKSLRWLTSWLRPRTGAMKQIERGCTTAAHPTTWENLSLCYWSTLRVNMEAPFCVVGPPLRQSFEAS